MAKYLFLCGVGRSGTTVACELLNAHPKVVMGVERYKYLYGKLAKQSESPASLFSFERFYDFRQTDTNSLDITSMRIYASAMTKYKDVAYAGDKWPRMYRALPAVSGHFEGAKFIFIVRNPADVASSWEVRAKNPRDSWPAAQNYADAVREWNVANALALRFVKANPDRVLAVRYEELCNGEETTARKMFERLGLDYSDRVTAFINANISAKIPTLAQKPSALSGEEAAYVHAQAKLEVRDELLERAGLG